MVHSTRPHPDRCASRHSVPQSRSRVHRIAVLPVRRNRICRAASIVECRRVDRRIDVTIFYADIIRAWSPRANRNRANGHEPPWLRAFARAKEHSRTAGCGWSESAMSNSRCGRVGADTLQTHPCLPFRYNRRVFESTRGTRFGSVQTFYKQEESLCVMRSRWQ